MKTNTFLKLTKENWIDVGKSILSACVVGLIYAIVIGSYIMFYKPNYDDFYFQIQTERKNSINLDKF